MRPRYLEIEGLQSFIEVQKVNFDELGETGLFGIFGPTGSGKSTVLDAMTLALYGEVNRVAGTQGIINTNTNRVRVTFIFDLIKGTMRRTYKIERVYQRKKGSENACEAKIARLIELAENGDIPIADKPREVTSRVENLLGLKHDDFTRAVVLPQNRFHEFLLMEKAKRREMLERIFYLGEYGKQLNEKVSKKLFYTKSRLSNVQGALSTLGDASDHALETARNLLEKAETCKTKVIKELEILEAEYGQAKEVWQLVNDFNTIESKEKVHLLIAEDIEHKKVIVDKAIKAEDLIGLIDQYKETQKLLEDHKLQLASVLSKLPEVEKNFNQAKLQHEDILKESETREPQLIERKTRLNSASEIEKEIDDIEHKMISLRESFKGIRDKILAIEKEIQEEKLTIENAEGIITAHKVKIQALRVDVDYRNEIQNAAKAEEMLKALKQNLEAHQVRLKQASTKIDQLQKTLASAIEEVALDQKNLERLHEQQADHEKQKLGSRDKTAAEVEQLHQFQLIYLSMRDKHTTMEQMQKKAENNRKLLEKINETLKKERENHKQLENQKNRYLQEIEHVKKCIQENTAYTLASSLTEGQPCPVCGSVHHPAPASGGTVDKEMAELEQQLENTEKQLEAVNVSIRDHENKCLVLSEQVRNTNEQHVQLMQELESMGKEYEQLSGSLPASLKGLSLNELGGALEKISADIEKANTALEEWEKKAEVIKNDISEVKEQLSLKLVKENGIRAELQANDENLKQAEAGVKEINTDYAERYQSHTEFLERYCIQSAASELIRITENDRQIEMMRRSIEEQQKIFDLKRKKIEVLQIERQNLLNRQTEIETDGKHLKSQKTEKTDKIKALAGDCNIEEEMKIVEQELHILGEKKRSLSENVKHLEEMFNDLCVQKNTLENRKDIYERNLAYEKSRIDNALHEKGFVDIREVEESVIEQDQQNLLKQEIEDYERVCRELQVQKNMILQKLDRRTITEAQWNEINSSYQNKVLEREEVASRYEVVKNIFFTTKERHEKWVRFNQDCGELDRKVNMLEQIRNLLKGNSFIEYIAEERLRYIAKEASEHLGVMTKYRYALELDTENGFIICDNANGGVHRLVSSLSGGETFLTSLSLALALSKQIQLKGQSPLEFFFLDEGFGTLDSDLLDSVIDSLERLSSKERVIGLISHVPDLKNRMPRRLMVNPPSQDGKGSMVKIEKA